MKKISILIISVLLIILSGCAAFFQTKVPMDYDSGGAYLEDLLVEKIKGGKLGTPSQVLVGKNENPSCINITWTVVPNAVSYRIECAAISPDKEGKYPTTVGEEMFVVLEESWYGTNYSHNIKGLTVDENSNYEKRYFYRIIAVNNREGFDEGDPSPGNIYGKLFASPKNTSASAGEDENYITIFWDFVEGAAAYDIYKSQSHDSGYVKIKRVQGNLNNFKEKIGKADQGKEFYYKVRAVNKNGIESNFSSVAMGYSLVPGAPAKPKNVKIVEGQGRGDYPDKISLVWDKVQSSGEVTYSIYRYSSKDSSLTRLKQGLKTNTYTDTLALKPSIYYNYLVQASVTKEGTEEKLKSAFSAPAEGYILSPPENVVAKNGVGGVNLTWDKALGSGDEQSLYKYAVYKSNELDGEYEKFYETADTSLSGGDSLFYKITTLNSKGQESSFSDIVSPAPVGVDKIEVSKASYAHLGENPLPDGANDAGVYPVLITWKKPENATPYGYHVYRSLKEDSGYRKITQEVILCDKVDSSYIDADETLKPGKVYYYKVLSVNTLDQGENYSSPDYGWGALTHERYLKQFNETIISSQKKLTLMHKPGSTDKLGSESKNGSISGNVYYNAAVSGLGAYITMKYTNYADFYINDNPALGIKFELSGNSDTSANMSSNGTMNGTITCKGMYPGKVNYDKIQIKAGAAGGGTYGVTPEGLSGKDVPFYVLEEK